MTNDIQQARDVLAKWREDASPGPWARDEETGAIDARGDSIVGLASRENASSAYLYPGDDALIVGTAGNPDLLDAIDKLLEQAFIHVIEHDEELINPLVTALAVAIIGAAERMSA